MATATGGAVGSGGGGSGSGTVTSVGSADGSVVVTNPTTTPDLSVPRTANWTLANVRWYAIDAINGDDSFAGFSDVSSAAAGLVAKKTPAGLGAIFPRQGGNRKVVVVIGPGTYTDSLDAFLSSVTGYAAQFPIVLATGTNTTASAVAFAGDANDKINAGFVTATGMNAAGYNPVSPFSVTSIKCLTAAAGAPGFPAETLAPVPMGLRIRFGTDAGTQAALRNVAVTVIGIPGTDTLLVPVNADGGLTNGLTTTPLGTDTFYLEMPGVTVSALTNLTMTNNARPNSQGSPPQIVGINFSTSFQTSTPVRLIGCTGALSSNAACHTSPRFNDENGTARIVGFGARCVGDFSGIRAFQGLNYTDLTNNIVTTGNVFLTQVINFNLCNGSYVAGGLFFQDLIGDITADPINTQPGQLIGGKVVNAQSAVRVRGSVANPTGGAAGMNSIFSSFTIGRLDISNQGANPAFKVIGKCAHTVTDQLTGSTGNTDVGMDLVKSVGSLFVVVSAPTLTGSAGDIRLSDGTIATWTQVAASGLVDKAGNTFLSAASTPTALVKFSGGLLGGAGATTSYLGDAGTAPAANLPAIEYPISQRLLTRFRVKAETNTFATTIVATVYKNNVATAMTVTITAGSTAVFSDTAHTVLYGDGDTLSVVLSNASDAGKTATVMAVVEGPC